MPMVKSDVPNYLAINPPRGRIDPIVLRALDHVKDDILKDCTWDEILKSLKPYASTIQLVTRQLRREHQPDLDRLLLSNPVIYARALAAAIEKSEAAQRRLRPKPADTTGELVEALKSAADYFVTISRGKGARKRK